MQKTQPSKFLTLYSTEDIEVLLEYNPDVAVVHWKRLEKLTPSSYKKLKELQREWSEFLPLAGYDVVYAAIPRQDNKSKKLAMFLGFFYLGSKGVADIYAYRSE